MLVLRAKMHLYPFGQGISSGIPLSLGTPEVKVGQPAHPLKGVWFSLLDSFGNRNGRDTATAAEHLLADAHHAVGQDHLPTQTDTAHKGLVVQNRQL